MVLRKCLGPRGSFSFDACSFSDSEDSLGQMRKFTRKAASEDKARDSQNPQKQTGATLRKFSSVRRVGRSDSTVAVSTKNSAATGH